MRLLLVRHGESTWNVDGRYQGRKDPPLTPRGEAQAEAVARRLRYETPASIATSPLMRASQTARVIAAMSPGIAVRAEPLLLEIQHGEWEGKLLAEVAQQWPDMLKRWRTRPEEVQFPGGESLVDVRERWRRFLEEYAHAAQPFVVVTHDIVVRIAVLDARDEPLSAINSVSVDNGSLTELEGNAVRSLNETAHLGDAKGSLTTQAL